MPWLTGLSLIALNWVNFLITDMPTQKQKFALYARLQELGFTYEESVALRRIEMTLRRWAEAECNGEIFRSETTNKPFRAQNVRGVAFGSTERIWPIADREAGALKRLAAIIDNRNLRCSPDSLEDFNDVLAYHQTDPRGCMLYLVKRSDLSHGGEKLPIETAYVRGLAVCC